MDVGHLADWLLGVLFLAYFPYFGFLLVTSLAAVLGRKQSRAARDTEAVPSLPGRRFLAIIPAHDEEGNIAATVLSVRAMNYPDELFQVLVIADNCTDRTAERAREAGARVIERFDATRQSKGYALEDQIDRLVESGEFDALDALVVIDADSIVHPDLLRVFARGLDAGQEWIQCYDCVGNADQSWRTRLMAYAFSLINGVTLLGQKALGLSAGLRGNGMCLSTRGLRRVPWRTRGLTEDIEYSWSVRIAGGRVAFDREAVVYATMLSRGGSASVSQRQRWESGRNDLKRRMLGPLLRSTHLGWTEKMASVIELTMPATTSLICAYVLLSLLAYLRIWDMLGRREYAPVFVIGLCHSVATLALAIQAASPFLLSMLPWRFGLSLLYLPYYVMWRFMVAFKTKPSKWVRTTRESGRSVAVCPAISPSRHLGAVSASSERAVGA
jgi:cellulose synthase/poly-beta-1,6-N-acetylglucosamine synthase-like glycosyltransferase